MLKTQNYLLSLSKFLDSPFNSAVRKAMRNQKFQEMLNDGPSLEIYKRCGWEPPKYFSEDMELKARREVISKEVSNECMNILDQLSDVYERYLLTHVNDK